MTHRAVVAVASVLLLVFLLLSATAPAQQRAARLQGTARDSSGLVMPGVLVVATHQETGVATEGYTNEAGLYVFPFLQPGLYTVTAEVAGFKKTSVTDFVLEVATTKVLDLSLTVGGIHETVTVKADSVQQVQTSTSDIGELVLEKQIKDLPLNGRLPIELVFLQPGMAGRAANGARTINNAISMDGVDITSSEFGTSTNSLALVTDVSPSVDVIEEFRVITGNPSAEYGRASGFQVEIATKSGTNELHGSAYDFYRDTSLNANSFFNNASPTTTERPKLHRHQFGGTIGGPVIIPKLWNGRNRTFFFFNYEANRQSQGITVNRTVLTKSAREGLYRFITPNVTRNPVTGANLTQNSLVVVDPVTGELRPGVVGIQSINLLEADKRYLDGVGADTSGLVKKLLDSTPLPNTFDIVGDGLNTAGFRWRTPAVGENDLFSIKVDHAINSSHNVSVRTNWGSVNQFGDTANGVYAPFPGSKGRDRIERQRGAAINLVSRLRPTMTNEARVGFSRNTRRFSETLTDPGILAITPALITNPYLLQEPLGYFRQTLQFTDNLTWVKGRHSFKVGFTIRSTPINTLDGDNAVFVNFSSQATNEGGASLNLPQLFGNPSGSAPIPTANQNASKDLFNFLVGRVGGVTTNFNAISEDEFGPQGTGRTRGFRSRDWGVFFQDDWKFNRNLTLNLGVRFDYFFVPWEVNSFYVLTANRRLIDTQLTPTAAHVPVTFERVGPKFDNGIYSPDRNNFAPIVGFSWDPFGKNKTAIRGSYRISYDHLYSETLYTIEARAPGLNGTGQTNGDILQGLFNLTNGSGQRRSPRLTDLAPSATNTGLKVGSGSVNLGSVIDIRATQRPLAAIPNDRLSLNPSDFEKGLMAPYSQSWSFGIQHEIMRNTVLEVRYVGRKGNKEFAGLPANQFRAPTDIVQGLQSLQGLLKLTAGEAFAKAGVPLPSNLKTTDPVTISMLYGSAASSASSMSQYTPGALASLAPQALYKLMLAGNNTFDSAIETNIRNNNLVSTVAAFDTNTNLHNNSFLTAAGLKPRPDGVNARGWLPLAVGLADNAFRPNIQFLNGPRLVSNAGYSSYHSLQVAFNRRFHQGLQAQANYTFSKNIDLTSTTDPTAANVTDFFQRNADKSVSANDLTHDFEANLIYELPFGPGKRFWNGSNGFISRVVGGWQLSSIIGINSGYPMTVSYDSQSSIWQGGTRPNFSTTAKVDGSTNDIGEVKRDSQGQVIYFTQDDFAGMFERPLIGTLGNVPPLWLRAPGGWDCDISLQKSVRLMEGRELQLRGEFFNAFNHVTFNAPNTNLESGSFGRITGGSGPRVIQLAAKFYF